MREETHDLIYERFGPIPLLEGYGATEAAPVIAVNKPEDNRRGTVGAPELAVPRKILKVPEVPVLGTGKTDYVAIQRMAETETRAA